MNESKINQTRKTWLAKCVISALAITLALGISTSAAATLLTLEADMDGAQANAGAGTGSPGTGTGTMTYETTTRVLNWSIVWSGLVGTPTAMHFHGPALPNQNAGIQVGTGIAGPPVVGNATLSVAQEADLLAGLWYLNLHTTSFGGGEIRGQVLEVAAEVPGPGLLVALPIILLSGLAARGRFRGKSGSR
jgi:hypothetical protein